jgi:hypothetical protein
LSSILSLLVFVPSVLSLLSLSVLFISSSLSLFFVFRVFVLSCLVFESSLSSSLFVFHL